MYKSKFSKQFIEINATAFSKILKKVCVATLLLENHYTDDCPSGIKHQKYLLYHNLVDTWSLNVV